MAKKNTGNSPAPFQDKNEKPSLKDLFTKLLKIEEGQNMIIANLAGVSERLATIEADFKNVKDDIQSLKKDQHSNSESIHHLQQKTDWQYGNMKEFEFELARQEQYSRKASVRIFGVDENEGENVEALCIQALKEEIDVDITDRDIDIVHRVGRRRGDKKARPILLKCMSHKTKSEIMRKKKTAKNIKVYEDLAQSVKRMLDDIVFNKKDLGVENVWTMDGKVKFKYCGSDRVNFISSHQDFLQLMSKLNNK